MYQKNYLLKFLTVGVVNTIIGYCIIFTSMYVMRFSPAISNLLGYSFGFLTSYVLNRNFTFKSNLAKNKEFVRFFIVFCISYAANFAALLILIYSCKIDYALSQLLAGGIYIGTSYYLNKHYVFRVEMTNTR